MEPGGNGPAGIAPFSDLRELGKDWAIGWLETLVRLEGVGPTAKMIEDLHRCVNNCSKLEKRPTMTDVLSYVQFHELRTAFAKFVDGGTYGKLFSEDHLFDPGGYTEGGKADPASGGKPVAAADNGDPDSATKTSGEPDGKTSGGADGGASGKPDGDSSQDRARPAPAGHPSFSVFETHAMMDASETVRVLSLDYIFEKVQRRFDGRPTLVVFDEAWSFFSHKLFIERIRSWLKEGRKNNVGVLMATQSLNDAIRSELTAELMESCPTKIFLPNMQAQTKASADSYRALGLSEPEIAQIARMRPKRDYYVTQPEGRRVLSFPIGHLGLSIVGRTSARDSRRALAAADRDGCAHNRGGRPHNRGGRPHTDFWKEGISDAFQKMGATKEQWQNRNDVGGETRRGISAVRKQENPPAAGQRQETAQTQTDGQRPDKEDKAADPVATRDDGSDESAAPKNAAHGTKAQDAEQETAG